MSESNIEPVVTYAAGYMGLGGGVVGLVLYIRKLFKDIGLEDSKRRNEQESTDAVTSIIQTMREELARLATMNKSLSTEIEQLQHCVIMIRKEKDELALEVAQLTRELSKLRADIPIDSGYAEV